MTQYFILTVSLVPVKNTVQMFVFNFMFLVIYLFVFIHSVSNKINCLSCGDMLIFLTGNIVVVI